MSRSLPKGFEIPADFATSAVPPKDAKGRRPDGRERKDYRIQLVTPMFGGGVDAGELDTATLISAKAVRGQLRFWWRVLNADRFADSTGLVQREIEIFGNAEQASALTVRVDVPRWTARRKLDQKYEFRDFGPELYALFAAKNNDVAELCREGLNFTLHLEWATLAVLNRRREAVNRELARRKQSLLPSSVVEIGSEIQAAAAAWIHFGGLGARTRRGVGGLNSVDAPLRRADLASAPFRVLVGAAETGNAAAMSCWAKSVEAYQNFRQGFRGKKHSKRMKSGAVAQVPGRSHWPEPDSLRAITRCALKPEPGANPPQVDADQNPHDHSKLVVIESVCGTFPRGAMGLPIIFHFADGPDKDRPPRANLDPPDATLIPDFRGKKDRMASPVITRPIHIDGRWHPAVILLPTPHHGELKATLVTKRIEGGRAEDVSRPIPNGDIIGDKPKPAKPMQGKTSAIEAFAAWLVGDRKWTLLNGGKTP